MKQIDRQTIITNQITIMDTLETILLYWDVMPEGTRNRLMANLEARRIVSGKAGE